MKKILIISFFWIMSMLMVVSIMQRCSTPPCTVVSDTVFITSTIVKPVIKDSLITKYITRTLPVVHDTCIVSTIDTILDSIKAEIPITSKVYQGDDYRAVISGYEANLDTISVISRTITNTITKKPPRFGIGPTVGYGMTNKGLSPYIGIGVYYNLFTF